MLEIKLFELGLNLQFFRHARRKLWLQCGINDAVLVRGLVKYWQKTAAAALSPRVEFSISCDNVPWASQRARTDERSQLVRVRRH